MERVLVIGAARSGTAAARLLAKNGASVTLTDANEIQGKEQLEAAGIRVADKGHPEWLFAEDWDYVVKNPGIPYTAPVISRFADKGIPLYTEIETASRLAPGLRYAAVTGTDGKTTITTLLHQMLLRKDPNAAVAGNIGIPLSEVALESGTDVRDVALELSNFQLLGIESFRPEVSVVSNLAPDHLDYMDSLESYYASKMRIYENCGPDDWFIRNVDDENILHYAVDIPCRTVDFSLQGEADLMVRADGVVTLFGMPLFDAADLKLAGRFNLGNAMMAAAMAWKMGVSVPDIRDVIRSFHGVEHRIEYVDTVDGVRIYNDSKATNTHAACAALSAFDSNVILLCGGKDKHISFEDMKAYDGAVRQCIAFGQTKGKFKDIFSRHMETETMEEALQAALSMARCGDVILLSPACSSFDQFKNYEERGRIFKDLVHRMKEEKE